jgi:hypothetical protein
VSWGDTGSNPLLSMVTLGSITVAGGAVVGSVSAGSRTLTRLLMVLRILLTFTGVGA